MCATNLRLDSLLGGDGGVDVGEDTACCDGDTAQEPVELLVIADGELHMARHDASLLVVTRGVTGELEDLSSEILEDGSEVHGGTCTDTGGYTRIAQVTTNTTNGELETRLGRLGGTLGTCLLTATT